MLGYPPLLGNFNTHNNNDFSSSTELHDSLDSVDLSSLQSSSLYELNKTVTFQDIRFATLNVCGLVSKKKIPDLNIFLKGMDIVCFTETKLDNFDGVEFCGYTCFTKNRRNLKNRSGGICILVRDELLDYVHVIESLSSMKTVEGKLFKYYRFVELPLSENALFF
jgi:hypothetical protein